MMAHRYASPLRRLLRTLVGGSLSSTPKVISDDDAVMYGFVEPEIRGAWARGARSHVRGAVNDAVQAWSEAMVLQRTLAKQAGVAQDWRFFGPVWTCAIGHIAVLATYAQARELGLIERTHFKVDASSLVANRAYLDYLSHHFEIINDAAVVSSLDTRFRSELPAVMGLRGEWLFLNDAIGLVQEQWTASGRPPLLRLREEDRKRGNAVLRNWGVPSGAWFVTLHVREGGRISGGFGTDSVRNADPFDYIDAIGVVTAAGGWVIRIGASDYTPLPSLPGVIDYATSKSHEDWIDVFLLGAASFMIATNSGPAWVANSFGVPTLFTNWAPIGVNPLGSGAVVLRKSMRELSTGHDLVPSRQRDERVSHIESLSALQKIGYSCRPNEAEDIATATRLFVSRYGYRNHSC